MTYYSYHCRVCGRWTAEYRSDTLARAFTAFHSWWRHRKEFADIPARAWIGGTLRYIFKVGK